MPIRLAAALAALGALALAGCQTPVRPDRHGDEPVETPAQVVVKPAAPPAPPEPAPEALPPAPPKRMDTGAEVFDRLSAGFTPPVCIKGTQNRTWRKRYAGNPANFARHLQDILPLLAYVTEEVDRRGLPAEFALIPIVESWYRPDAIGPGGPAGMWQMIASTARNHGIVIAPGYDGRLSPVESTDAALAYLQTLSGMFDGEWRATVMGYNAGEYRILRAFNASGDRSVSGERHLPHGLSRTTYDYVAKLRALACLIDKPERHNLVLPRDVRFTPLARLELPPQSTSLDQAARMLGVDAAALRRLNPAFRQGRVVAGAPRTVLAPETALESLVALRDGGTLPDSPVVVATARTHQVQRGDTLSRIASRYGVPLKDLFSINGLSAKSILHPGQVIRLDP